MKREVISISYLPQHHCHSFCRKSYLTPRLRIYEYSLSVHYVPLEYPYYVGEREHYYFESVIGIRDRGIADTMNKNMINDPFSFSFSFS